MFLDRRTTTLITGKCKATGEIEGPEGKPVRCLDCYSTRWTSITVSQLFDLFEKGTATAARPLIPVGNVEQV